MWCEEINEKYSSMHRSTVWWWRPSRGEVVRYVGANHPDYRPLPWPARDVGSLDYTLQLLAAFYDKPSDFINRCGWVDSSNHPIRYPQVRAWMLRNLVSPAESPSASYFKQGGGAEAAAMPSELKSMLGRIAVAALTDPGAKSRGGASNYPNTARVPTQDEYEDIVVAIAEIILVSPMLDIVAWPWLWVWASSETAKARTRVFALKALGAIVGRGTIPPSRATIAQMESLVESISNLPPPKSYQQEREQRLLASDAAFVIGTLAAKLHERSIEVPPEIANFRPPGPPPPPAWMIVTGALSTAAAAVGAALLLRRRRSRL